MGEKSDGKGDGVAGVAAVDGWRALGAGLRLLGCDVAAAAYVQSNLALSQFPHRGRSSPHLTRRRLQSTQPLVLLR